VVCPGSIAREVSCSLYCQAWGCPDWARIHKEAAELLGISERRHGAGCKGRRGIQDAANQVQQAAQGGVGEMRV
jgi:hypothetical protein